LYFQNLTLFLGFCESNILLNSGFKDYLFQKVIDMQRIIYITLTIILFGDAKLILENNL